MSVRPLLPRLLAVTLLGLLPCLVVCAGGAAPAGDEPRPLPPPKARQVTLAEVDALVSAQKLTEAIAKLEAALADAQRRHDDELAAYALVHRMQLRVALGGFETAVRELKETPWPTATLPAIAVELYYAHALSTYVRAYGYEIGRREKIDTKGQVDLKAWTRDQIVAEATRAFASVWKRRVEVSTWPVALLSPYLEPNTYPPEIRGTLRDAIAYLAVEHLADSSLWRADQSNELFRVAFAPLVKGGGASVPLDGDAHPIEKIGAVLDDLEAFHARAGHAEAALEARLERLRRLHAAYPEQREREVLTRALAERLARDRPHPWWAMGQALLAEWAQEHGERVRAHGLADEGRRAYPSSMGGRICAELVQTIEAPELQVSAMAVDAAQKPSVLVTARNLPKLYLRAYRVDLLAHVERARDYGLLLDADELRRLLGDAPVASWTVDLAPTPDYQLHRTHVTPPIARKGFYVIVASERPDFRTEGNRVAAAQLMISDLVLSSRADPDGALDVTVFDGPSGKLVDDAEVELWMQDWRSGHHRVAQVRSVKGVARLASAPARSYFVLARRGEDLTLDPSTHYLSTRSREVSQLATLVYTDRSVYRPGQKIFWKAIVYAGQRTDGRFRVQPDRALTITLRDANYQEVQKLEVRTNAYGSASGELAIPASGRLLGGWHVVSSLSGTQAVRVEEYKRPTFEVTLKDPAAPLRLNEPAKLTGEARYYFGLPVTAGRVRYTVTRAPVYPYWWHWYYGYGPSSAQTIARGTSPLRADGTFDVAFLPEAAPTTGKADRGVSYRYAIEADVTDDGGETRSAQRGYRLGTATIEAAVAAERGFYAAGAPLELTVRRTDLDGKLRAGKGRWRLLRIDAPAKPPLPADLPVAAGGDEAGAGERRAVPGDARRARFETGYDGEQVLATWKDGAARGGGEVTSDEKDAAKIALPGLPAGAYRLRYETADERGEKAEAFRDFLVVGTEPLPLPGVLRVEDPTVHVGGTVRLLAGSGLAGQTIVLDTFRAGALIDRRVLSRGGIVELPMKEADRGGLAFTLTLVRDHQAITLGESVHVPWDNQALKVSFATFRDKVRPGAKETFRVTVAPERSDGKSSPARLAAGAAELLAYMYDRSLDLFAPHAAPSPLSLFPGRAYGSGARTTLGPAPTTFIVHAPLGIAAAPRPGPDRYGMESGYGVGGMGYRGGPGGPVHRMAAASVAKPSPAPERQRETREESDKDGLARDDERAPRAQAENKVAGKQPAGRAGNGSDAEPVRSNFSETAFFQPHLLTDGKGEAAFEFTVPDSVTSWSVWVHAVTKDLRSGSAQRETRSVKDLMVRPYLPRFFREGDQAELRVVVNNAGTAELSGTLSFDVIDPETKQSRAALFSAKPETRPFTVAGGKSVSLAFPVTAPRGVGDYAVLARATAAASKGAGKESFSDGELRPVPVLPSRLHLSQSRFVTLRDADKRTMRFDDLARDDDASRVNEQLVVTLDAQLFYTVLRALPYLIEYPYECAEQTLNRFVSTGIVTSLFRQYPQVAKMADQMSRRTTQLQAWDAGDANRKMALEEAPFLREARGGATPDDAGLINVLDERIARANRDSALVKLQKMQTSLGAFPWFPGGPPSPYMTLYVLYGFAKAAEFKVEVPKEIVQRGWQYLARHYRDTLRAEMRKQDCCWEFLALLGYVASSYPDATWTGDALTMTERKEILDYTWRHRRDTSPYVKGLLALTLARMGRAADGRQLFESVMDSAKTAPDQGTFWAQEDRSWLWYNDTIESHAFALRVLMELDPKHPKKDGLVLWLLLNKKLNQWKSTRATAEVIYSLAEYMKADQSLGVREAATVSVGPRSQTYTFEPDRYVGKVQMVIPGGEVTKRSAEVAVAKQTKGVMFASATWSFATDQLPTESRGDFFTVSRRYFVRENDGRELVLRPLADGTAVHTGDEVEVELAISSKHEAEYVHLRDPRGAGFEPLSTASRFKWDLGLGYYEEVRDSGANFFFEHLPAGQYTFRYRLRATTAGTFRVGPATLQSMYAPEFSAYSAGHVVKIMSAN